MSPLRAATTGATTASASFSSPIGTPNLAIHVRAPANTINRCNSAGGKTRHAARRPSNLDGSFRPNVLAVLSQRFSLSVPFWLPWTIVHLQRGGADNEDDFGTNPKYPGHKIHARDRGAARAAHRRLSRGYSTVVWRSRVCSGRAGQRLFH